MTEYRVLKQDEDSGSWAEVAVVEAVSAGRAKRLTAEENGEGAYVAVPKRSWQPTSYTRKTLVHITEVVEGEVDQHA